MTKTVYKEGIYKYDPFYVNLYYKGDIFPDTKKEKLLEGIAKKHGGILTGGGTDFPGRDYNFVFSERNQVKKFLTYVRKVKRPFKVNVWENVVEITPNDISRHFSKSKK